MFRILKCTKDTYLQNKIVAGARTENANVGKAGTLDLFKLYDETYLSGTTAPVELSRTLLKFDLDPIRALTGSVLSLNHSSFKCFLSMKDIYGGQSVPSNYTLSLYPLAKTFDEGRGSDVVAYRDQDSSNWITSSITSGVVTTWSVTGAYSSGSLTDSGIDYYVSGVLNPAVGTSSLGVSQSFTTGDEDLLIDVTTLVSGVVAGIIPDNGFRLSFISSEETDGYTRFVKRFSSRHVRDQFRHPRINVHYDDSISDLTLAAYLDKTNTVFVYNRVFGTYQNFLSGGTSITSSNSLMLTLVASRSISTTTTSWSTSHSASITYTTSSWSYFSSSFTGSQLSLGGNSQTGIYSASFFISSSDSYLGSYLGQRTSLDVLPLWQSLDKTLTYTSASTFTIKKIQGSGRNVVERNFVTNVTNLKQYYTTDEVARLRLFVQDYNTELKAYKLPIELVSEIYDTVHWRLLLAFTREVIVDFDTTHNSTKLSSDAGGMYFDLYMADLVENQVYELEFLVRENSRDYLIVNQGFRFKVIP